MPDVIPGGSPRNPMGVAAMTLAGGEYAIHGTNMPGSVGGFVSYGCIRMYNEDITDLYQRVSTHLSMVRSASSDAVLIGKLSGLVARARWVPCGAYAPLLSEFVRF